jgi:hypothetical protein
MEISDVMLSNAENFAFVFAASALNIHGACCKNTRLA